MISLPFVFFFLASTMLAEPAAVAATINVPVDQPTIQAGINAANPGDTVLVADNVWSGPGNQDISFNGKDIIVRSSGGATACIIDCGDTSRGFLLDSGEQPTTELDGFTIQNGNAAGGQGGGIYVTSRPVIRNCVITDCTADQGAGICLRGIGNQAQLIDCVLTGNSSAEGDYGGGIYVFRAAPLISGCLIEYNFDVYRGGGIAVYAGSIVVTDSDFLGNSAYGEGGAVYGRDGSTLSFTRCTFDGNTTGPSFGDGGAIRVYGDSALDLVDCTLSNNSAAGQGGGISTSGVDLVLRNCQFTGNMGTDGAVVHHDGEVSVTGCSFSGNEAGMRLNTPEGTGLVDDCQFTDNLGVGLRGHSSGAGPITVTGCTVTGNDHYGIRLEGDVAFVVADCLVRENTPGIHLSCSQPGSMVTNCMIEQNDGIENGFYAGGVTLLGPVVITDCVIRDNTVGGAYSHGAGVYLGGSTGGLTVANCLITGNSGRGQVAQGGGMYINTYGSPGVNIRNCSLAGNGDNMTSGKGIYIDQSEDYTTVTDCIFRDWSFNEIVVHDGLIEVTFSNVWGGWAGTGNLDSDPLFASGPEGDFYLGRVAAGQTADSPCADAGSQAAVLACFDTLDDTGAPLVTCMDQLITRTDLLTDDGQLDMGYHYFTADQSTVAAAITCVPASGTVPFQTVFSVTLTNLTASESRRVAGRLDVTLGGGQYFSNWRAGWSNLDPGAILFTSWAQQFPDLSTVIGDNLFQLVAEDVTPAPYNQPPYTPAGDSMADQCTVTAISP